MEKQRINTTQAEAQWFNQATNYQQLHVQRMGEKMNVLRKTLMSWLGDNKAYNLQNNGNNEHTKKILDNTTQWDNQLPRRTVTDTQFPQRGRKESSLICYQLEGFATRKKN